ncbi:hypothetical protein NC653_036141 [Populus alba x Populus x berolinensis]|uniref:Uncharacterized protein n=1 Tax=Populus alba x Populus x berolinensis TaxID=444605 RepID=A0AAD6PVE5_9ROSI|nr:hypothetical protein NC653_036141 [Populus alba x Populus x berolinensis]
MDQNELKRTSVEQSLLQPRGCTLKSILNTPMNPIFCWLSSHQQLPAYVHSLIAQKTAKRVSIQNPGKFQRRQVTGCKENQVIYYGKDPKRS